MEKVPMYFLARSTRDKSKPVAMEKIDAPPTSSVGLVGEVRAENEYYVVIAYCTDMTTYEYVSRKFRDFQAVAQEWMIPAQPPPSREAD